LRLAIIILRHVQSCSEGVAVLHSLAFSGSPVASRRWRAPHAAACIVLVAYAALGMCGCSSYAIRGRVVGGGLSHAMFTSPDDPTLGGGQPIAGAAILLYRDPDQLNRAIAAEARSSADGWFVLPVDAFGAGWMEESWEVVVRAPGRHPVQSSIVLPGSPGDARLLVVMSPGRDVLDTDMTDPMDDYERYK
jgi:hypothetical protein